VVTNLFVRKKKIKGREYYYVVNSTRTKKGWKKVERYVGINPPADLQKYAEEFDSTKEFLFSIRKLKFVFCSAIRNNIITSPYC